MREVTLRVRHRGGPESEVSARHPEVTLRSVSSMTGTGAERKRIVELRGPTDEIESFLTEFRRADPVVSAEPISPIDGGRVYVALIIDTDDWEGIGERLSDLGVHFRMGTTISGGIERWTVYLDADADLSALIRGLERGGNDVELARNVELSTLDRSPKLPAAGILDGLTDRQREVLATAIAIGYYDHGGGVGVEDVAAELGIGSTTAWEHLSRAESTVMNALFDRFEEWGLPGEHGAERDGGAGGDARR
ncbi:helix-turn-helix domain-containing protein [Halorubrum sp. CSM-61]|uniref:helix-turn-helix domain-containing protein n=1 Tax=Halorubrum sp. CSM-61 TaxID=2485838 RepID=UPI000F4C2207|nr:helix-turn-helix domain-containing protein [Halorubrum sp. CSM-61]